MTEMIKITSLNSNITLIIRKIESSSMFEYERLIINKKGIKNSTF